MFINKKASTSAGLRHKYTLSPFMLNNRRVKMLTTKLKNRRGVDICGHRVARFKGGSRTQHSPVSIDLNRTSLPTKALVLELIKTYKKTCLIALIKYSGGSYSYILSPWGLEPGAFVRTIFKPTEFTKQYRLGYLIMLRYLEPHTVVFGVEVVLGRGSKYALAGGTRAIVLVNDYMLNQALVELPTGAKIWINSYCTGILGRASNIFNRKVISGKAGMSRLYNKRPIVRGVAKNPVDHPHGGRTKTNSPEVTPWNRIAKKGK